MRGRYAKTPSVLQAETTQRKRAPSLPKRGENEPVWRPETRKWWRSVWHSPMAAEFLDADISALYRLAVLIDQFWAMPDTKLASEIRLQQQAFGLTPLDRKRLQWTTAQAESATTRKDQRRVRAAQDGDIDPREVLRAVK